MTKIPVLLSRSFYRILLACSGLFLLSQNNSIAQKNDYIVIQSTKYTEGDVKDLPSEGNTVVYFRRVKHENFQKYTIDDVDELMFNQRKFFRKTIETSGVPQTVYLELLPEELNGAKLWCLNQEKKKFYIGTDEEFILLDESYQSILEKLVANHELNPLIAITNLNWYDLAYLFNTAKRYKAPQTFTTLVVFTPYAGVVFAKNQFTIPNTGYVASISGTGSLIGIGLEAFLNFKRNISLNLSPSISTFGVQTLLNYDYGGYRFESDIYMEYSTIQLPITTKYYIDLRPNKLRAYIEGGFVIAINDYKKLGMHIAQQEGNSITTFQRDFSLESKFNGYSYGIGIEKYFNKANGIVFGIKNTHLKAGNSEKTTSTSAFAGFKF